VSSTSKPIKNILNKRNNQIDMYEEYFEDEDAEYNVQKMEIKTMKLFKDKNKGIKRAVNNLSWHPDGPERIAASYCIMRFQQQHADMKLDSFIWDVHNPNMPIYSVCPVSPIGKDLLVKI
jgi:dynein intermediate chain 2